MLRYIGKRLLIAIPTLIIVSIFVFLLQKLLPGDPALVMAGEDRSPEVIAFIREKYRLNDPLIMQYFYWIGAALQGDFGVSLRTNQPVMALIGQKLPVTIQLAIMSMIIAFLIGIPAGIVSAIKKGTIIDYIANVVALSGLSIPNFWLGIMLILLFSQSLRWLPSMGYTPLFQNPGDAFVHLIMPAFTLGTAMAASLTRFTRSEMLEQLRQDYVRTARAKGLRERAVLFQHVLKNSMIPTVTVIGLQIGGLLEGAVITETVFAWPGIGRLAVQAVFERDYPLIQGIVLFAATTFVVVNLVVDISYSFLDPRVRLSGE